MKTVVITTGYDDVSRQLRTEARLSGFIPALPDQEIVGVQVDTVTLFAGAVMSQVDAQAVNASATRALAVANVELAQWAAAAANKDKADMLPSTAGVE